MAVLTKAELEEQNAELKAKLEQLESGAPDVSETVPSELTIAERLIEVARQVGVLEPKQAPSSAKGAPQFKYRGIDSTVAHVTPWLNRFGIIIIPNVREEYVSERTLNDGRVVKTTRVVVDYTAYGPLGDSITGSAPGLADDFADRSTAQAMSVAYRTFLLQAFHIAAFGEDPEVSGERVSSGQAGATSPNAKVANAQRAAAGTAAPVKAGPTPAEQMRSAIMAAGAAKGMDGAALSKFADGVTGKPTEEWWGDPDQLNLILSKINDAPAVL